MDMLRGAGAEESLGGVAIHRGLLDADAQAALTAEVAAVVERAPFFAPITPWGKPMSVRMTAAGRFGWFADRSGYRYVERHPDTGEPWPPIPPGALAVWREVSGCGRAPECCLINWYGPGARMGLHRDEDEADFSAPVVSISLGAEGRFRVGGLKRRDPTRSTWLRSGDVAVLGGQARLVLHGLDRIRETGAAADRLWPGGGRINLTLRVVA